MIMMNLVSLPSAVPLGVYTGGAGQQAVLEELNNTWRNSGSGVLFGQDVFGERFKAFSNMVISQAQEIKDTVLKTIEAVCCPNKIQEIFSDEDFRNIPACMYIPLLTDPMVRPLFEAGQISGWDISPADLPTEDVVGRLIKNGSFCTADPDYDPNALVKYTIKTGDPDYTREQLLMIKGSREFIDTWLEEQLSEHGDNLDFTNYPNRMGKLKPVD